MTESDESVGLKDLIGKQLATGPLSYRVSSIKCPVSRTDPPLSIQQMFTDVGELAFVDQSEALFKLVDHAGNGFAAGSD